MGLHLFIALCATFLWLNTIFSEYISAKVNPYSDADKEEDIKRAKFKIALIITMALFWTVVFSK